MDPSNMLSGAIVLTIALMIGCQANVEGDGMQEGAGNDREDVAGIAELEQWVALGEAPEGEHAVEDVFLRISKKGWQLDYSLFSGQPLVIRKSVILWNEDRSSCYEYAMYIALDNDDLPQGPTELRGLTIPVEQWDVPPGMKVTRLESRLGELDDTLRTKLEARAFVVSRELMARLPQAGIGIYD